MDLHCENTLYVYLICIGRHRALKDTVTTDTSGALAGRLVLVTGASRGVGCEIAVRVAAEGAHVGLLAETGPRHLIFTGTLGAAAAKWSRKSDPNDLG